MPDLERSIKHVTSIAEDYHNDAEIDGRRFVFEGANVLELGPGAALGAGVPRAGLGIQSYRAIDAFPLARVVPKEFYLLLSSAASPSFEFSGATKSTPAERLRRRSDPRAMDECDGARRGYCFAELS